MSLGCDIFRIQSFYSFKKRLNFWQHYSKLELSCNTTFVNLLLIRTPNWRDTGLLALRHVMCWTPGWFEGKAYFCLWYIQFSFQILNHLYPFKEIIDTRNNFSTSVKLFSFAHFLGLTGSWIGIFVIIQASRVFLILFLQVIRRLSGVSLDKLYPCPDKLETLKLYFWICISEDFSILVLLLE